MSSDAIDTKTMPSRTLQIVSSAAPGVAVRELNTHGEENLGPGALITSSESEKTVASWCLSTMLQKSRLVQYLSWIRTKDA